MIADQIRRLFAYNTWAWQHVYAKVEQLPSEAYLALHPTFHDSIHNLLVHSMVAEWLWYERCQGKSPTEIWQPEAFADFDAVRERWAPVRHGWANYLQWLSDDECKQFVEYRTTEGVMQSMRLLDIFQHVINHATEHRSQLTPLLYQLGFPTEPLDYSRYRTHL